MEFDIKNMLLREVYDHPVKHLKLIETHISWVILTGDYAYKIKKPVNFGFLDFSTLEKRHTYCLQEVLLNSRLAAAIYLDVVAITGTKDQLLIKEGGEVLEYAVKMAEFPQSAQLDNMLAAGDLGFEHMAEISRMVAGFHQTIEIASEAMDFGDANLVYKPVEENFIQIAACLGTGKYVDSLAAVQAWSKALFVKLEPEFAQRKDDGFIRECHGDMHLRNLLWMNKEPNVGPMAFDCIEFNSYLRWIDVMSEVAFLVMDLQNEQQSSLANCFLNGYLEQTGDYAGLSVFRFYLCYRAMVRAKAAALFLVQQKSNQSKREQARIELESYFELAMGYSQDPAPKLIITHGLSASGKSTVSQHLLETTGLIRIRSDVERKRLFSVSENNESSAINSGIYTAQSSQQTYTRLVELTSQVISAGYGVIVDATFLKHEQRELFQQLAGRLKVPYIIIDIAAPVEVLRKRIMSRKHDISDADIAVLEFQILSQQSLQESEQRRVITVDTTVALEIDALVDAINAM